MNKTFAARSVYKLCLILVLVAVLPVNSAAYAQDMMKYNLDVSTSCPTALVVVTLHSEQVRFCAPTLHPANVVEDSRTMPEVSYAQFNQRTGYGIINIKSVASGNAPGPGRPAFQAGQVSEYRRAVWDREASKADRTISTSPSAVFWNETVVGMQIDTQLKTSLGVFKVRSIEWYVEHQDRLWSIVITWDTQMDNQEEWARLTDNFSLETSAELNSPDTATDLGAVSRPSQPSPQFLDSGIPVDMEAPSWWSGTCDDDHYFPYTGVHAELLGASWHGIPSCGPRPNGNSNLDYPVAFISGAHQEFEFECVELVMRFLYQEWGIEPWPGNGNEIRDKYTGSDMVFYDNGSRSIVPGDILTEDSSVQNSAGHTAIITAVYLDENGTGIIYILEQNTPSNGERYLQVTNWSIEPDPVSFGQTVQGWFHVIRNQITSDNLYASTSYNLWQIDPFTTEGGVTGPMDVQLTDVTFLGKTLYGISYSQFFSINPVTGTSSFIGYTGYSNLNALATGLDGTIYAGSISGALLKIDPLNGQATWIGSYGPGLGSSGDLAVSYDNKMYATVTRSGYFNDWLAQIDMTTGRAALIGDTGESGIFGLAFKEGFLLGVTTNGRLLEIDTNTGGSTLLKEFSENFWGLATFGPVDIFVGGALQNSYDAPASQSLRVSYPGLSKGSVEISHTHNALMIGSERVVYKVAGLQTSYSEMMGLPNSQLDTTYWLPWYNNVELETQLRVGNVSNVPATIRLYINDKEKTSGCTPSSSPFTLAAGDSLRVSCTGVNSGPVKIVGTQNIVAAERIIYRVLGLPTSYSEMMGLPNSQLDKTYWLPWYNNTELDTQLRIGNVSNSPTTVHFYINGKEKTSGCTPSSSPFNLAVGESLRISCAGVNSGPVKVVGTQNIVAAERIVYKVLGLPTSYSEMMGLPGKQLDTLYWLPWYNNTALDTQLRIGNIGSSTATVYVFIGGEQMEGSPFTLGSGASLRQSFNGINQGPVLIESDVPIVAAERVVYKVLGIPTSYSEMMGLPNGQLDTTYWLPWYNNLDLDTQLRFGLP